MFIDGAWQMRYKTVRCWIRCFYEVSDVPHHHDDAVGCVELFIGQFAAVGQFVFWIFSAEQQIW